MSTVVPITKHKKFRRRHVRDRFAVRAWNRTVLIWIVHEEITRPLASLLFFGLVFVCMCYAHDLFAASVAAVGAVASLVGAVNASCDYAAHRYAAEREGPYDDGPPYAA